MKSSTGFVIGLICLTVLFGSCAGYEEAEYEAAAGMGKKAVSPQTSAPSQAPAEPPVTESEAVPDYSQAVAEEILEEAPAGMAAKKEAVPSGEQAASSENRAARQQKRGISRYLSADDSNSAASPVIARRMILQRRFVEPARVRTYEFLNYYSFDYPAAEKEPISIIAQMRALSEPGKYSLQIALRSRDRELSDLSPFHLTFLLDTSGSMVGSSLALAKSLISGICDRLRQGDMISLIACNRSAEVLLEAQRVDRGSLELLEKTLAGIRADDVTDLEKGIVKAYEVASRNYDYRYLNRVVIVSDGAANIGQTAAELIGEHAEDSDRQGIYLAGIGVGEGFDDQLMNTVTDKGRGAYLYVDGEEEIGRILDPRSFVAAFDLAVKDVRLKVVMPPGWSIEEFHGEQMSAVAADVVPQYLSPNDQMIYHLVVAAEDATEEAGEQVFEFEAEFTPIGGRPERLATKVSVAEMLARGTQIRKGDAVVAYAEMLKAIRYPLDANRRENLARFEEAYGEIAAAAEDLADRELREILALLETYGNTLRYGERFPGSRDGQSDQVDAVLGLSPAAVGEVKVSGCCPDRAVAALERLLDSRRLVPMEGYKFLILSSGPVGNPYPAGSGELSSRRYGDPMPEYMGWRRISSRRQRVYDLHQVRLELTAPQEAKSFSFDFNFFSSEYPEYVNQSFNDTFYAVIEAASTNRGRPTNIAFDSNNNSIEVDNNYFQNPFHPIPNTGTGFDMHGSTGWLRTSWPIRGGERFTLTFSIHDEGDAIYDSLVILDNFRWHEYDAVGTTDPLN